MVYPRHTRWEGGGLKGLSNFQGGNGGVMGIIYMVVYIGQGGGGPPRRHLHVWELSSFDPLVGLWLSSHISGNLKDILLM